MILLLSIIISIYVATQYLHISVLNSLMANTLILRALASLAAQLHDGFQKVESLHLLATCTILLLLVTQALLSAFM